MHKITIYLLHKNEIQAHLDVVLSLLDQSRFKKANQLSKEDDRLLSYGGGYLMRKYLPNQEIKISKNGKPYFEYGPHFSLSHSHDFVGLCVQEEDEIGFDIEYINEDKIKAIRYVLSGEEAKVDDVESLFKLWTNKESLIKCRGDLLNNIRLYSGLPLNGAVSYGGATYYRESMIYKGYAISVSSEVREPFTLNLHEIKIV